MVGGVGWLLVFVGEGGARGAREQQERGAGWWWERDEQAVLRLQENLHKVQGAGSTATHPWAYQGGARKGRLLEAPSGWGRAKLLRRAPTAAPHVQDNVLSVDSVATRQSSTKLKWD